MDHETAASLLTDYARGRLGVAETGELRAHLAACSECREVAAALPEIAAALGSTTGALFEPHPAANELGLFALAPDELDPAARDRIEAHARVCPTCSREVELARGAERTAWMRAPETWVRSAGQGAAVMVLRPALAVLAALLVYPAYLGLVVYPEARRSNQRLTAELRTLERRPAPGIGTPAPWSGAASLLVLSGPERAGSEAVPGVRLRPGQPYLAVLVAYDPPIARRDAPTLPIEVRVARDDHGGPLWRHEASLAELWDPSAEALSLLVPTADLSPGSYRLELRWAGSPAPRVAAPFKILPAAAQ